MTPDDLNLPARFSSYRDGQLETALDIATSGDRFQLLSAPTGAGKSLIYATVAKLLDARALVLVGTKGLQQQLLRDFASAGMHDIRGQSNYRCLALDADGQFAGYDRVGSGCDRGPCHYGLVCDLKKHGGCLYYDAVDAARQSQLVVTNYAYWMSLGKYSDPTALGKFDLIILDEAHTACDWLTDFCSYAFTAGDMQQLLSVQLPSADAGLAACLSWAERTLPIATEVYEEAKRLLDDDRVIRNSKAAKLGKIVSDLQELIAATGDDNRTVDWIVHSPSTSSTRSRSSRRLVFSPVWPHDYSERYLFRGIPRALLCSATLSTATAKHLGISRAVYDYYEMPSGFHYRQRPLTYIRTCRVDNRMPDSDKRKWINRIDEIIDGRTDRKGIIHTRSYDRAREIVEGSRHSVIMLAHDGRTARQVIDRFKRADPSTGAVLVSPSVEEGFDFPGDECRYQIIAKVPFVFGRDPMIHARKATDRTYVNHLAAQSLIQMVGRGMRSRDDWCETIIIDDHWGDWFSRRGERERLFPGWFVKSWRSLPRVMQPMKSRGRS